MKPGWHWTGSWCQSFCFWCEISCILRKVMFAPWLVMVVVDVVIVVWWSSRPSWLPLPSLQNYINQNLSFYNSYTNTDVLLASTGNFINDKLSAKIQNTRDVSLVTTADILNVCQNPWAIKSSIKELEEKRALKCGVCENLAVISVVLLRLWVRVFVRMVGPHQLAGCQHHN